MEHKKAKTDAAMDTIARDVPLTRTDYVGAIENIRKDMANASPDNIEEMRMMLEAWTAALIKLDLARLSS
jgi:hypothetical protein